MSIHDGHRERLKKQFLKVGLDGFAEVNVLEMLLFYCIPRRDTNPIAHALLSRFGSLTAVFEAPVEELVKVEGGYNLAAVCADAFARMMADCRAAGYVPQMISGHRTYWDQYALYQQKMEEHER